MFIQLNFFSQYLDMNTAVTVLLPDPASGTPEGRFDPAARYPTVYLLHGAQSDHTAFTRFTNAERYAQKYGFAVVMPEGQNSYYADMAHGPAFFSYLSKELPAAMEAVFPLSPRRADRFAAGYSMGGRGAFLLALTCPDRFCAAASLSGSLDTDALIEKARRPGEEAFYRRLSDVFGDLSRVHGGCWDVCALMKKCAANPAALPQLYLTCGLQDSRYETQHLPFVALCQSLGVPVVHDSAPGGHDFDFWDGALLRAFSFFANTRKA